MMLGFQYVGRQQPRGGEVRPQIERQAQQQHGEIAGILRAQRAGKREIGLGDPVDRARHRRGHGSGGQRSGSAMLISGALAASRGQGALRVAKVATAVPARWR